MKVIYILLAMLLIIDVGVNFFKAVRINGTICEDFDIIAQKYLKCRFVINSIVSVALILSIILDHSSAVFLRFFIFLKAWDLWNFEEDVFRLTVQNSFFRESFTIFKILLLELFGIHVASCLFYLIGHSLVKR